MNFSVEFILTLVMIFFTAGINLTIIKLDIKSLKRAVKELSESRDVLRHYIEKELTKITLKFDKRIKILESELEELKACKDLLKLSAQVKNNKKQF